jgi:ABC-type transporter Mla maintaining outer membrane lipid asymmetry ATPase subunit MlaF
MVWAGFLSGRAGGSALKLSGCLVEIIGANLHFRSKTIFDHFDPEITADERLVLLGPSRIGKSTLLRILLGTLKPENGRIQATRHGSNPARMNC